MGINMNKTRVNKKIDWKNIVASTGLALLVFAIVLLDINSRKHNPEKSKSENEFVALNNSTLEQFIDLSRYQNKIQKAK